jgi:hypothetical protein
MDGTKKKYIYSLTVSRYPRYQFREPSIYGRVFLGFGHFNAFTYFPQGRRPKDKFDDHVRIILRIIREKLVSTIKPI